MRVKKELRELFDSLRYGYYVKPYKYVHEDETIEGETPVLWGSEERDVIGWQHFGSSANDFKIGQLKWIVESIFGMTPEQFMKTYKYKYI